MIDIKRSHLVAATAAPLVIVLAAAAMVVSRGRSPAPRRAGGRSGGPPGKKDQGSQENGGVESPTARRSWLSPPTASTGSARPSTNWARATATKPSTTRHCSTPPGCDVSRLSFLPAQAPTAGSRRRISQRSCTTTLSGGGTLYASDLRYDALASAFPEFVDPASVAQGIPQDLRGEVTSPELRDLLGPAIMLHFKSDRWRPAAFRGDDVSVLLKGQLKTTAGRVDRRAAGGSLPDRQGDRHLHFIPQ